jgi:hypothetical protein
LKRGKLKKKEIFSKELFGWRKEEKMKKKCVLREAE